MAELADAPDLGSGSRKAMGVRLPPFALLRSPWIPRRASACRHVVAAACTMASGDSPTCPPKRRRRDGEAVGEGGRPITSTRDHENRIRRRQRNAQERARRNPERRGGRRDRPRRARLLAQGAHARLPPGQDAGPRHQAALQGSDPPRRRARSDSARGRRCAARARRRGGRHARRPRRDDRGRPAADLHRVVRHGAGVRAGRLLDDRAPAAVERDRRRGRRRRRCSGCASARRGSSRSKAAASTTATPCVLDLERRDGDQSDARTPTCTRTSASSSARRPTRRASTSSCSASRPARPRPSPSTIPADYPIAELAGHRRLVHGDGEGHQAARAAGARRRVREGPRASSRRSTRCGARARGSRARGAARRRARGCAPS